MEPIQDFLPFIADGEDKSSPLASRIRKNYKHIRKMAKRTDTNCFRIYDREIPSYPLAIDFYAGRFCIHYFAKGNNEEGAPEDLIQEAELALKIVFGESVKELFWKTRSKSKTTRQYEKFGSSREFFVAREYGVKFWINLEDYLDTGLFLDHRNMRQMAALAARDKTMLNLFAYTCAFSVHAAFHGAKFTKSVDMSNTYCHWGEENFLLNGLSPSNNEIVRADCLKFLAVEDQKYDVIVIDPPTISRSKKMDGLFDIQADYPFLIERSLRLLKRGGVIFFSTNLRKFALDETLFPGISFQEITKQTLPDDFNDPKIHRSWKIFQK